MRVPLWEAIFDALHQRMVAAFPDIPQDCIERNRASDIGSGELLPRFRIFDGDQAPTGNGTPPEVEWMVAWDVEGSVSAPTDAEIGPAMNALHARVIEAMVPGDSPIVIPLAEGFLEVWLEEDRMTRDLYGVEESEFAGVTFTQGFTFRLLVNRGEAFVDLPDGP